MLPRMESSRSALVGPWYSLKRCHKGRIITQSVDLPNDRVCTTTHVDIIYSKQKVKNIRHRLVRRTHGTPKQFIGGTDQMERPACKRWVGTADTIFYVRKITSSIHCYRNRRFHSRQRRCPRNRRCGICQHRDQEKKRCDTRYRHFNFKFSKHCRVLVKIKHLLIIQLKSL